jgi:hypothetical protein
MFDGPEPLVSGTSFGCVYKFCFRFLAHLHGVYKYNILNASYLTKIMRFPIS